MGFDVSPFLVSLTAVQGFTAANRLLLSVGLSCFIRPGLVRYVNIRLVTTRRLLQFFDALFVFLNPSLIPACLCRFEPSFRLR